MRWRDWWSAGLAAAAAATAVFAVGGAQTWAQVVVAILATFALAPVLRSRRILARRSPLVVLPLAAAALTALQLVPLPHRLLAALVPTEVGLRDDGGALLGSNPVSTITFDAPNTIHELLFFVTLAAVALVAVRVATTQTGRYRILVFVAALSGATAVVVGIHSIVGTTALYGIFTPRDASPPLLGPLVNTNHLGCLMAIGALVSFGLLLYQRQHQWLRATWMLCGLACTWTTLATMSRGATLALLAGGLVMVAVIIAQRWFTGHEMVPRRRSSFLTSSLPLAIVGICAIIVVVYTASSGVSQQFSQTSIRELDKPTSKFVAWRSSVALIEDAPWTGTGRGAFQTVFTRVHPASAVGTYKHLENEYLQAVVDWGIPGALVLAGLALWLVVSAIKRWREGPLAACGLAALAAVLLQSNVDFGVERLGVALPITLVVATLVPVPLVEAGSRMRRAFGARFAHVTALAILAAVVMLGSFATSVDDDHRAMDERAIALDEAKAIAQRHPLDYYSFSRVAQLEIKTGDPDAIAVLNHALRLHPSHPGLHLVAARLLMNAGHPDQATVEYATALENLTSRGSVLEEIAKRMEPKLAATALPQRRTRIDEIARELERLGLFEIEIEWLDRLLTTSPELHRPCELEYQLGAARPELALRVAGQVNCRKFEPTNEQRLAMARAIGEGHPKELVAVLGDVEAWQETLDTKLPAWLMVCDAQRSLAQWDEARRCLHLLDSSPGITTEQHVMLAGRLDALDEARRHP